MHGLEVDRCYSIDSIPKEMEQTGCFLTTRCVILVPYLLQRDIGIVNECEIDHKSEIDKFLDMRLMNLYIYKINQSLLV